MPRMRSRTGAGLRRGRRPRTHGCRDHLYAAPLRPLHGANPGTPLRTCDAVGACLVVPRFPWVPRAPARGTTLRRPPCLHWTGDPLDRLQRQRARGAHIVGADPADEALRPDLRAARRTAVAVLGHERHGIPPEALDLLDLLDENPKVGTGAGLDVAVAGWPALYNSPGC